MTDKMDVLTKAMWNIDESLIQDGLDADEEMKETAAHVIIPLKKVRQTKLRKTVLL